MERIGEIIARGNFPKPTEAQKKSTEKTMAEQNDELMNNELTEVDDPRERMRLYKERVAELQVAVNKQSQVDAIKDYEERKAITGYAPNPNCLICHGGGLVHPRLPDGKPDYSQAINCQAKGCLADQRKSYQATEAYFKKKGVSKFSTFDEFKPVLGADATLQAFMDIASNEGAPPFLFVYGTTGNGKTHLCEATLIQLLKRGIDCRLYTVPDLINKLHQSIPENTTEQIMSSLKVMPALIMDEWGQNYGSDWEEQKLEEIVIARERAELITIITSNLEPDKLPDRIASRFRDRVLARLVDNKAPDYRPKKKAEKRGK